MRSTLDPVPEIPKGGSYVVGIDTGQNSVGHAAIALDKEGNPVEILAIQSVIHDSGVDPDSNKTGETRLAVSGVARRNRRRIRTTKRRLREIDSLLTSQGWIKPAHEGDPRKIWFERALAASEYIEDEQERKRILYAVFSHIARHRGWRNPYQKLETLFLEEDYCPQPGYREVEGNVTRQGAEIPSDATIGQMIAAAISLPGPAPDLAEEDLKRWDNSGQLGIRSRSGGKEPGLLSGRQFQEDYAAEVRAICRTQRIDDDTCRKLIRTIFKQKEPGKAAIDRVGKDELQPDLPRVATAHPQFQRYRIAATLAALTVIGSNNSARRLTANERQKIAAYLAGDHQKDAPPEWSDVAEIIGVDVTDIRGIATPTGDPTMLVGHRPPTDITNDRIQQSTFTTLKKWWRTASSAAREDLINSHINYEDATDEVDDLLLSFTEKDLTKLDGINFPTGRGAYSADTCKLSLIHI